MVNNRKNKTKARGKKVFFAQNTDSQPNLCPALNLIRCESGILKS
jgi:hypothetical protein